MGTKIMNMKTTEHFISKDLGLSGFLHASRIKITEIKNDGKICWFMFADKLECERLADLFWLGEAMVNARDYYSSLRTLKDLIFNRGR